MAERFTGQRCQDCQGGLAYIKEHKYWECPYCGKIYERELRFNKVQIDGLAGINDLVRSTLSKLLALDLAGADKDLAECEKINHASVGTQIAAIAIALFKSMLTKDRQQELARLNALLQKLNRDFPQVDEAEEILYDFIDSPDIYALLATVYGMTGQSERRAMIYNLLDCRKVLNQNAARFLLGVLLKDGRIEDADAIIGNLSAANCRVALATILSQYPSNDKKAAHVDGMLAKLSHEVDVSKTLDTYFEGTSDDGATVLDIFLSAMSRGIGFNTTAVICSVLQNCRDAEHAQKLFAAIKGSRLDEATAKAVLMWCIESCPDPAITAIGFASLFESTSVYEITKEDCVALLKTDQDEQIKLEKLLQMLATFKMTGKSMDDLLVYHLLENTGSYEYRRRIFDELLARVRSVPMSATESYLLKCTMDGACKAELLKATFEKSKATSLCTGLLSSYLNSSIDSPEAREAVIRVFLSEDIVPDSAAFSRYLLNFRELHSADVLEEFERRSCRTAANTFDQYLEMLDDPTAFNSRIAAITTRYSFTLRAANYAKYLLKVEESPALKVAGAKRYLEACTDEARKFTLRFEVAGATLFGNIAQAYLFTGSDNAAVMQEILSMLAREKVKADAPMENAGDGKKVKPKKFVDANSSALPAKVEELAKQFL